MEQPNYYAVLPASVRYAKISANAKLLYAEITALANKSGKCWATNAYFAKLYDVEARTVSRWVTELVKKQLITIEIDQRQATTKRALSIDKNVVGSHDKNVVQNITSKNNKKLKQKDFDLVANHYQQALAKTRKPQPLPAYPEQSSGVETRRVYDAACKTFGHNPLAYKLTPKRQAAIRRRLRDCGLDMVLAAIGNVLQSPHHRGENPSGWRADLDWLLKSYENVEKWANYAHTEQRKESPYEQWQRRQLEANGV